MLHLLIVPIITLNKFMMTSELLLHINYVFYSDDLCIMSASPSGLQKTIIDICVKYSLQNSLTFNYTESVGIVFKPKKINCIAPI